MSASYPIVIVTGANGGVGYGICQRLLASFCGGSLPQDALPQPLATPGDPLPCEFTPTTRFTLIMACRSPKKATAARDGLIQFVEEHIARQIKTASQTQLEHMKEFRKNLEIDLLQLDLASSSSTFRFCDEVSNRYPYISHLILNAGCAPWAGLDWPLAIKSCIINLKEAVTRPRYKLQTVGVLSDEGLGWVFQCNVFGHFMMVRSLQDVLQKAPWTARVVWTASLDVEHTLVDLDWDDWQLRDSAKPYEASKYQIELISHTLDQELAARRPGTGHSPIRHLISHPGVTSTAIFASKLNFITSYLMWLSFVLARLFGSPFHPVSWINGAIAAAHLALVPLGLLPPREVSAVFGARATRFGNPYVDRSPIVRWEENKDRAKELVEHCDGLYAKLKAARKAQVPNGKSTSNGQAH